MGTVTFVPATFVPLEESLRNGLISTVVCGLVSALAAFALFLYLLNRVLGMARQRVAVEPITYFYLSLLFWDTITALGMMINVRWVVLHGIKLGHFCTSQALIQQLSSTGGGLSIAALSFAILYNYVISPERPLPPLAGPLGILLICIVQAIDIGVPNGHFGYLKYYGTAGYWCWISNDYFWQKIFTEYFFFWFGAVFFIVTASVFAFARYGLRARVGFLWLGFFKGDKLFRFGLVSLDAKIRPRPKFGLSYRCDTYLGVLDLIPIQYFDKFHATAAVNDDLDPLPRDSDDNDTYLPKEEVPTYTLPEPIVSSPLTPPELPRTEPSTPFGSNDDPEIDQMVRGIYSAPNGSGYHQDRAGPPLVPNRFVPSPRADGTESIESVRSTASAVTESPLKLLLFPLVYFLIVAPLSIARFLEFSHKNIPPGWVFFAASWFSMQGFLDVLMWKFARPAFGIDYTVDPLVRFNK